MGLWSLSDSVRVMPYSTAGFYREQTAGKAPQGVDSSCILSIFWKPKPCTRSSFAVLLFDLYNSIIDFHLEWRWLESLPWSVHELFVLRHTEYRTEQLQKHKHFGFDDPTRASPLLLITLNMPPKGKKSAADRPKEVDKAEEPLRAVVREYS